MKISAISGKVFGFRVDRGVQAWSTPSHPRFYPRVPQGYPRLPQWVTQSAPRVLQRTRRGAPEHPRIVAVWRETSDMDQHGSHWL